MLADPQRPVRPGEPGIAAASGRGDAGKDSAGLRVDLQDPVLGDLVQIAAVEGGSRMRGDLDGADDLTAGRVQRVQPVAGREPDLAAVEGDAMNLFRAWKGPVFPQDFSVGVFHRSRLCKYHIPCPS